MSEYSISYDQDHGVTRVKLVGDLDRELGDKVITESRVAAADTDSDLLYDVRDSSANVSLADWFFLPRRLDALKNPEARSRKVAVIVPSEDLADYRFYEDVARNAGLSFRVFLNEIEALGWLSEPAEH
ncbi:MAG: hypothetical protein KJO98_09465 [Rhodothermia bacterium]|nr:hypothetical protein [Rhodothermia bacterium]